MSLSIVVVAAGAALFLLLVVLAFAGPSAAKATQRRISAIRVRHSDSTELRAEQQLKKAIAARKRPNVPGSNKTRIDQLGLRLGRTGKSWTINQYLYATLGLFGVAFVLLWLQGAPWYMAAGIGGLIGAGIPHFVVGTLISGRLKKFTARFPDAIDLLVRGLKSGLPVGETLGVVAKEIPGPVGEEFKMVVERMKIGRTMEDSLQVTADRMGTPEFQFFVITLAIQRETGGNLAETLANLSEVLRKRAQMKLKIKAMSSESKASAYIVGCLPFFVFGMVYWVNPEYLQGFFYEDRLIIAGLGGLVWMSIGAFIMAKMVSFEI